MNNVLLLFLFGAHHTSSFTIPSKIALSHKFSSKLHSSLETSPSAPSWQENLDNFLDPFTPPNKKQALLNDLLNQNKEIRESLNSAFEERKIDPLLTPRVKQLQKGTRAVSNQLRKDIIPNIAKSVSNPSSSSIRKRIISAEDIPSIASRIAEATSNQVQNSIDQFTQDLQDPKRVPERLSKQSSEILQEIGNIFRDTPEGLKEPPFQLVSKNDRYEVRDYEAYIAASTSMIGDEETTYSFDDAFNSGNGFNTLATYLFGKNKEEKALSMTTPVTITNDGEMQFYLYNDDNTPSDTVDDFPSPVDDEDVVKVKQISSCRLAVARFTGFVTDGEVSRQKEALLNALKEDGYEVDSSSVDVPHIILQYNPPYTLPVLRRNEIAIPVKITSAPDDDEFLESDNVTDDVSPSDG